MTDVLSNKGTARRRSGTRLILAALLLIVPISYAFAATMQNIEFSSLPGDKIEIRMIFDERPPAPTGYTIEQPARIALDLMSVSSALDSKYHALGSGNARSITVVEADDRTRVIVSLSELVAYSTQVDGNMLVVRVGDDLDRGLVASTTETQEDFTSSTSSSEIVAPDVPSIEEIDFRRGERGEGRVIVNLSDPGVGVDVSTEGGKIRVAFSGTFIPESLQRRLDVTDFATPVLVVDALPEAGNTVLTVEPTTEYQYEYLAYQADDIFTLEVKPTEAGANQTGTGSAFLFRGEKLSLNFQDIEIRSVLQLIADFTDLNLVASDTVGGRITLRLKNVPWDQALQIIMKAKGLDKRQVGNVLMVAPAAELAARDKLELESRQQMSELAPLTTEFIEVSYASARDIFDLFQSTGDGEQGVLSARGSVIVDDRTNSIILTETAEKINEFRAVLDKLDVPVRQVLIEARIVNARESFSKSVGVQWGVAGGGVYDDGSKLVQFGGSTDATRAIQDSQINNTPVSIDPTENLMVDLGAASNSSFAFGFVSDDFLLDLELSLAESEGYVETISRPKVITSDKTQASVQSGTSIPFQEASSSGATTTEFIDAAISLTVTPQITPDGRLILDLEVTNDEPGQPGPNGIPTVTTQSLTTQVLVDDGSTIVLGGLFQTTITDAEAKTPFFGDLPVVGQMFRRTSTQESKSELLIFITPRLIEEGRR